MKFCEHHNLSSLVDVKARGRCLAAVVVPRRRWQPPWSDDARTRLVYWTVAWRADHS